MNDVCFAWGEIEWKYGYANGHYDDYYALALYNHDHTWSGEISTGDDQTVVEWIDADSFEELQEMCDCWLRQKVA
jgi:hypothetical protein